MAFAKLGAPFPPLDSPTDVLLASGGDDRLEINLENGFNNYGCAPNPGFRLSYSYSTASTISAASFSHVSAIHRRLKEKSVDTGLRAVYLEKFDEYRTRLRSALDLPDRSDIIFGPSGTDLELVALALSARSSSSTVHNIVLGLDEVGSGIRHVAKGCYCKEITVMGTDVQVGGSLPGFEGNNISTQEIEIRNAAGEPRNSDEVLDDIAIEINWALGKGVRPLVHLIHRSKTGLITPNWEAFKQRFVSQFENIDIVVDACQGRISTSNLAHYLSSGAMILYTGSKFFGGAPFSGALFVPEQYRPRLSRSSRSSLPEGLCEFFTEAEWPLAYRHALPQDVGHLNFGLLLRWESALYELERYFAVPEPLAARVIMAFQRSVCEMCEKSDYLKVVAPTQETIQPGVEPKPSLEQEMIFTIELDDTRSASELDSQDAREIYRYLYTSFRSLNSDYRIRTAAETIVHLGQPVNCYRATDGGWRATLRVSLGAPLISDLAFLDPDAIEDRFDADMSLISDKIALGIAALKRHAD